MLHKVKSDVRNLSGSWCVDTPAASELSRCSDLLIHYVPGDPGVCLRSFSVFLNKPRQTSVSQTVTALKSLLAEAFNELTETQLSKAPSLASNQRRRQMFGLQFGSGSERVTVMELNKTVLHFLEICPLWGLVCGCVSDVIVTQGCLQHSGTEKCGCSVFKCH